MEKQKEKMIELLQEAEKENGIEAKAEFIIAKGVVLPPVQIGQTVYSLGKNYNKCRIGMTFDEFTCQGCEIECDSRPTYFVQKEIVKELLWDGIRWAVHTDYTWGMQKKGIGKFFAYDVFVSPETVLEEIERREKTK